MSKKAGSASALTSCTPTENCVNTPNFQFVHGYEVGQLVNAYTEYGHYAITGSSAYVRIGVGEVEGVGYMVGEVYQPTAGAPFKCWMTYAGQIYTADDFYLLMDPEVGLYMFLTVTLNDGITNELGAFCFPCPGGNSWYGERGTGAAHGDGSARRAARA